MSKWTRERIMYFGSQLGHDIEEAAEAFIDSKSITAVNVTAATFGGKVNQVSGEYSLSYKDGKWTMNTMELEPQEYGIEITGTPAELDALTVVYTAKASGWEALGKDNDDLSKDLNPDTETSKNVLGEATFTHGGYEPEISVDPYYIDPGRKLAKWIREIAMRELSSEADCVGLFAECSFTMANKERRTMSGLAHVRRAWFIPQSVGGDTNGANIPVNINPFGPTTDYTVEYDMSTNEPRFTPVKTGN